MKGNRVHIKWVFVLVVSVVLLSFPACDDTLQPFEGEALYSIHGALDMNEETNYIRVRNMRAPFTAEGTRDLDATVILQNLDNDESAVLESEIIKFEDIYFHNYIFEGSIEPNTNYRVIAKRLDGAETTITAITPTKPPPDINPINEKCDVPVSVSVGPLNGGTVVFRFGLGPTEDDQWGILFVFGPDRYGNSNNAGLTFVPIEVARKISFSSKSCSDLLRNDILYMRVAHYAPGFYELIEDELDEPEDLLESSRRFGAFYEDTLSIPVDTSPN